METRYPCVLLYFELFYLSRCQFYFVLCFNKLLCHLLGVTQLWILLIYSSHFLHCSPLGERGEGGGKGERGEKGERGGEREREGKKKGERREGRRKGGEEKGREGKRKGKRRVKEISVHAHTCITVLYETFVLMLIKTVNICVYNVHVHITRISRL